MRERYHVLTRNGTTIDFEEISNESVPVKVCLACGMIVVYPDMHAEYHDKQDNWYLQRMLK